MNKGEKMKSPTKDDIREQKVTWKNKCKQAMRELNNTTIELMKCASELDCMISMKNAELEAGIACTDETPPDYFDGQTVHEASIQIQKSRLLMEKLSGITSKWS